jgi:nitrogen regulatory protein PII
MVDVIFNTVMRVAHTGKHGDGKVYVLPALEGGRISSGERGSELA